MPLAAAIIPAAIGGITSIIGGHQQANAAKTAAQQQQEAAQKAIGVQQDATKTEQANEQPYVDAGQQSIGQLMKGLNNGTFGVGSTGTAPGTFSAPSLAEARATPGYQFTLGQGLSAIDRGAAARGGLNTGRTLQAEQAYGSGLADSTYNDVFNRSLGTYQANLQGYQANLQGQQQQYNQVAGVANLGQGAISNINSLTQQGAGNIGNLMTQQGNAQAAGTVGAANANSAALTGVSNAVNSGFQSYQQNQLLGQLLSQGQVQPSFNPGAGPGYGYGPTVG